MSDLVGHEHEFDGLPERGLVRWCVDRKCVEARVGTGTEWRELTAAERTAVTIRQLEDMVIIETGEIIHGKERGREWARRVLGY